MWNEADLRQPCWIWGILIGRSLAVTCRETCSLVFLGPIVPPAGLPGSSGFFSLAASLIFSLASSGVRDSPKDHLASTLTFFETLFCLRLFLLSLSSCQSSVCHLLSVVFCIFCHLSVIIIDRLIIIILPSSKMLASRRIRKKVNFFNGR